MILLSVVVFLRPSSSSSPSPPDGRILISNKSCSHDKKPLNPKYVRATWQASMLLTPTFNGSVTNFRYMARVELNGNIPAAISNARQQLIMSLTWETRLYFVYKNRIAGILDAVNNPSAEGAIQNGALDWTYTSSKKSKDTGKSSTTPWAFSLEPSELPSLYSSTYPQFEAAQNDIPYTEAKKTVTSSLDPITSFAKWCFLTFVDDDGDGKSRKDDIWYAAGRSIFFYKSASVITELAAERAKDRDFQLDQEYRTYILSCGLQRDGMTPLSTRGFLISIFYWGLSVWVFPPFPLTPLISRAAYVFYGITLVGFVGPWSVFCAIQLTSWANRKHLSFRQVIATERLLVLFRIYDDTALVAFLLVIFAMNPELTIGFIYLAFFLHCVAMNIASEFFAFRVHLAIFVTKAAIFIVGVTTLSYAVNKSLESLGLLTALAFVLCYVLLDRSARLKDLSKSRFSMLWQTHHEKFKFDRILKLRKRNCDNDEANAAATTIRKCVDEFEAIGGHIPGVKSKIKIIDFDAIEFTKQLGVGRYGIVYRGRYHAHDVAVKQIIVETENSKHVTIVLAELFFLSSLRHPNIIEFFGAVIYTPDVSQMCIVTEYAALGSLRTFLLDNRTVTWHQRKRKFLVDISAAMCYLHEKVRSVMHRDLKTDNCFVDAEFKVKVGDFGLSRCKPQKSDKDLDDPELTTNVGTPIFMAPEIIAGDSHYNEKADCYSFGMLVVDVAIGGHLCELISNDVNTRLKQGLDTRQHTTKTRHIMNLVKDGWRVKLPDHWTNDIPFVVKLIRSCCAQRPQDRPTFGEIHSLLEEWNGKLGGKNAHENKDDMFVSWSEYTENELDVIQRCETIGNEPQLSTYASDWYTLTHPNDAASKLSMRVFAKGGAEHLMGKCIRRFEYPSYVVIEMLWDWMEPNQVARGQKTGTVDRGIHLFVSDHHQIDFEAKNVSFPLKINVKSIQIAKLRVIWKETAPLAYVLCVESVEEDAKTNSKYDKTYQSSPFRAHYIITPLPDGSTLVEHKCSFSTPVRLHFHATQLNMIEKLSHLYDTAVALETKLATGDRNETSYWAINTGFIGQDAGPFDDDKTSERSMLLEGTRPEHTNVSIIARVARRAPMFSTSRDGSNPRLDRGSNDERSRSSKDERPPSQSHNEKSNFADASNLPKIYERMFLEEYSYAMAAANNNAFTSVANDVIAEGQMDGETRASTPRSTQRGASPRFPA